MKIVIAAGKISDSSGNVNEETEIIVGLDNKKPIWKYISTDTSKFETDGKISFTVKGQDKFLNLTKSGLQDSNMKGGSGNVEERENIRERLKKHKLSYVWLIGQLALRGIVTDKTEMSSVISGTRNGTKADAIIELSIDILDKYENGSVLVDGA